MNFVTPPILKNTWNKKQTPNPRHNNLLNNLKSQNIDVYYKELTTDDIKKTGIKVVKVIVPGLIDLNKSHIYPRLGAERFFLVPKKLKLKHNKELTEMPHPFP